MQLSPAEIWATSACSYSEWLPPFSPHKAREGLTHQKFTAQRRILQCARHNIACVSLLFDAGRLERFCIVRSKVEYRTYCRCKGRQCPSDLTFRLFANMGQITAANVGELFQANSYSGGDTVVAFSRAVAMKEKKAATYIQPGTTLSNGDGKPAPGSLFNTVVVSVSQSK